jgi:quercetin dioxygenase-like cupin family protein
VSETSWNVAHLDEIEPIAEPDPGEGVWKPVRHRLGIDAFGVNAWVAREPGDLVIEEHAEDAHEELYLVLSGRATFTVDGETVDAPAGTLLHVRAPGVNRKGVGEEAGTTVLAIGATPGEAFEVSPWEQKWVDRAAANK